MWYVEIYEIGGIGYSLVKNHSWPTEDEAQEWLDQQELGRHTSKAYPIDQKTKEHHYG